LEDSELALSEVKWYVCNGYKTWSMTHKALKVLFKRSEADRMALEKATVCFNHEFFFLAGDLIGWVYADDIFHVLYEQEGWTKDIKSWGMEMKYIIIFFGDLSPF